MLTLLALALVQAACARAIAGIDAGSEVGIRAAYRLAFDSVWGLLGALAVAVGVVAVLSVSIFLVPIAIWLAVRWALCSFPSWSSRSSPRWCAAPERASRPPAVAEGGHARRGRRGHLAIVSGPFLGALLILLVDAPFAFVNVLAGLVYAVAMPFVGIATTYVYYDTLARERLGEREPAPTELPAEI